MTIEFHDGKPFGADGEGWKHEDGGVPGECGMSDRDVYLAIKDTALDDYCDCAWKVLTKMMFDTFMHVIGAAPALRQHIAGEVFRCAAEKVEAKYENGWPDRLTERALNDAREESRKMVTDVIIEGMLAECFLGPVFKQLRKRLGRKKDD
jgi:hypothetical protein